MKEIRVLGPGCSRCVKLYQATEEAAKGLGIEYNLQKVSDLTQIMSYGVMMTPALVVDGEVKVAGRIPSPEELASLLK